ncbi:MAG: acyl-CoA dehydrogenase family protein [Acidimicrobiales bacterium]
MDLWRVGQEADKRSAEIESLRRLPDDLAAMVVDTGLLRQWVPQRYGGGEAHVIPVLDAIEELAYHDGSTGWVAMIGTTTGLAAAYMAPEWASEVFGDPRAVVGGYAMPAGAARAVDGGVLVNGRWQWGSGTHHCTWIGGGCALVDDAGQRAARADGLAFPFVLMAPDQVQLLDTWRVAGLKGTGSTDYLATDAFIPEGRWVQFLGAEAVVDSPLYRFPFLGALALGVASVAIGLARRGQDELANLADTKRPANSSRLLAERALVQVQVSKAEAAWRSARAFMHEVVNEAWAEAVDLMYHAAGGSAIHESSPLQRVFRDVHVATQHGMVAERVYEPLGRMALGLPTDATQL